jgi:hypothetical protein
MPIIEDGHEDGDAAECFHCLSDSTLKASP